MTPHYADDLVTLYHGDCLDVLRELPDASVDAVVTDPPYGLEFMGKEWDRFGVDRKQPGDDGYTNGPGPYGRAKVRYGQAASYGGDNLGAMSAFQQWCEQWATECLRVLKPGGHMLAFGGTRTWHRLACAVEDAGFEVRDSIAWLYGSGFPKSLDVSKAIDKAAGAEREVVGIAGRTGGGRTAMNDAPGNGRARDYLAGEYEATAPATDDARTWQGWGTALKPAFEPVVVARKPLAGMGINVVAVVESALRANGVTGDIRWTFGLASDVESPSQSPTSSATPPLATAETSAAHVVGGATRNDARPTASSSASTMPNGERETASTSEPMPASATPNSETPSSPPTARIADAAEKAGASSSPSITSTVAERSTASRSTERSTRSSAEKVSHPVTESFAGIATGLSGSLATVRIERLPDGSFAWPAGLPFSTPGGSTTVAQNVLAHGTGALNIDATRIGFASEADERESKDKNRHADFGTEPGGNEVYGDFSMVERRNYDPPGRWPANVVLDESQAAELDRQSGVSTSAGGKHSGRRGTRDEVGTFGFDRQEISRPSDEGGASRFFYVAKAPTAERPREDGIAHPTVKPLDLMRWLVRLVTPPGGVVLEPFAGSGTTAEACVIEGFRCIAIEREADYLPLIVQRLTKPIQPDLFGSLGDGAA